MILNVKTRTGSYPVILERDGVKRANQVFDLNRKCMIITDENIPKELVQTLFRQCGEAVVHTIVPGEASKTLAVWEEILSQMLTLSFTRRDCVIALGGGVVGDLAGFVASAFLRGVDFYNIPTTLLSQVDSSIGGKVAVNHLGLKNMIGAFYPPKAVLVDITTLSTLPKRHFAAGMAEVIKMAMTFDEALFSRLETMSMEEDPEEIIEASLKIKQRVVEEDEREAGLRRVLNFGHTFAHAIESESHKRGDPLFHGECVSLGMIPMCSDRVRERLLPLLEKASLPTSCLFSWEALAEHMQHDKKMDGKEIWVIRVEEIGSFEMEKIPLAHLETLWKGVAK